jgi:hypothetical protein
MGENFFILTPSNDTIFAIETEIDTNAYGLDSTKLLNIKFSNPLVQNGSYILIIKPNDQNSPIENICGAQWLSDSITISVTNCINLVQVENEPNEKWIVNEKQWGVNLSNKSELTLIDLNGRLVYSQMLTNGFNEIPQDAIPRGMYIAVIDGRFSRKLFKL